MHPVLSFLVAVTFATTSAAAHALDDRYHEMGKMEIEIDGEPMSLLVVWDKDRGRGYATSREVVGRQTISVLGSAINENGKPVMPRLNLSFLVSDDKPDLISAELYDGAGSSSPFVVQPGIGSGSFTSFSFDGERIAATFKAEMRRVEGHTTGDPTIVEDAEPIMLTADMKVSLQQPE